MNLKEQRAIHACVHTAGFPCEKTFEGFDFSFQPSINKKEIEDFMSLRFMESNENIMFVGSSGTGKTHLATAIGIEAANLFFQLISRRYEQKSTIITMNKTLSKWGEIFGDPVIANAILDRLLHHSHIVSIIGPSYRVKDVLDSLDN